MFCNGSQYQVCYFSALIFCGAGMYQMSVWALGKHRNYKNEFPDYPKRKAILPFILWAQKWLLAALAKPEEAWNATKILIIQD